MKRELKPSSAPFDRVAFLVNFEGLDDLVKATIDRFVIGLPTMLAEIETAITTQDQSSLELNSHKLKGVVSNFRAEPARLLAFRLEKIATGELDADPIAAFLELKAELNALTNALESFRDERRFA